MKFLPPLSQSLYYKLLFVGLLIATLPLSFFLLYLYLKTGHLYLSNLFLALLLLPLCLILLLLSYLAKKFTQPLHEINYLIQEIISHKNFSKRLKIRRNDELGRLAKQFNDMCVSLSQYHTLLHTQNQFLEKLTSQISQISPNNVLQTGLHAFVQQTQSQCGILYLKNHQNHYQPLHTYLIPLEPIQNQTYAPGQGYVGQTAQNQQILHLSTANFPELKIDAAFFQFQPPHLLFIPIVWEKQTIAVIALGKNTPYHHTLLEFCKSFARYLSIGYDSAHKAQHIIQTKEEIQNQYQEIQFQQKILEKINQKLLETNEQKSLFLAQMSHEIRTPLTGILGISELLAETNLSPAQKNYLEIIQSCGENLLEIINNILDLSKLEAGKMKLQKQPFYLYQCIEETFQLVSPKLKNKNVDLLYSISPEIPTQLIGDPLRLRQILINLTSNAAKFTENGQIQISVEKQSQLKQLIELKFSIQDTGPGIEPKHLPHIFAKFTQAKNDHQGTGLGLNIAKNFVELMNGKIWVESKVGKGTTFLFTACLSTPEQPHIPPEHQLQQPLPPLQNKHILLLDPNPYLRKNLQQWCQTWEMIPHTPQNIPTPPLQPIPHITLIHQHFLQTQPKTSQTLLQYLQQHQTHILLTTPIGEISTSPYPTLPKPILISKFKTTLLQLLQSPHTNKSSTTLTTSTLAEKYPLHILVVEDNPVNQKVVQHLFQQLGYSIDIANNGHEAIQKLEKQTYHLVFMDLNMPEMDGAETTKKIIEKWQNHAPPIIAMTANILEKDKQRCLQAGMVDYISKPISLKQLEQILENWAKEIHSTTTPPKNNSTQTQNPTNLHPTAQPLLDTEIIHSLQELEGDQPQQTLFDNLYTIFLEIAPDYLQKIQDALENNSTQQLYQTTHAFKGACLQIGAKQLANVCEQLEKKAKEQNQSLHQLKKETWIQHLQNTYQLTLQALQNLPTLAQKTQSKKKNS